MARIAGVDIPRDKQVAFSLPYVYGIGRPTALKILQQTNIQPTTMVRDLTDDEVSRLRAVVEGEMIVEGDLRRVVRGNIQRLLEIILDLAGGVLEFLDSLAHAAGQLREFLRAEQDKNHCKHQNHFRHSQPKR